MISRRVLPHRSGGGERAQDLSRAKEITLDVEIGNQPTSMARGQTIMENWRVNHNRCGSHGSFGYRTPNQFVAHRQAICDYREKSVDSPL
jgi:hypothetical protein